MRCESLKFSLPGSRFSVCLSACDAVAAAPHAAQSSPRYANVTACSPALRTRVGYNTASIQFVKSRPIIYVGEIPLDQRPSFDAVPRGFVGNGFDSVVRILNGFDGISLPSPLAERRTIYYERELKLGEFPSLDGQHQGAVFNSHCGSGSSCRWSSNWTDSTRTLQTLTSSRDGCWSISPRRHQSMASR